MPHDLCATPQRSYDDEDDDLDDDDDDAMLMDTSMGGRTTPGAGLGRVGGAPDRFEVSHSPHHRDGLHDADGAHGAFSHAVPSPLVSTGH